MITLEKYIKQSPEVKNKIDWYEVDDQRYVVLKKNFQLKLLRKAIRNIGSQSKLAKFLKKSESQIRNYKKGKSRRLTVGTLKRLAEIAKISYKKIRENIVCLGGIVNPKLPFNMGSIEGIKIRAKFLSDGYNVSNPNFNVGYVEGNKEASLNLLSSIQKLIGYLKGEYGQPKKVGNAFKITLPPVFGDILKLSGVPRGRRGVINPTIPKDILQGNVSNQITYLREVFTDEGCVEFSNKYRVISLNRNVIVCNYLKKGLNLPQGKIIPFKKLPGDLQRKLKTHLPKLILGEYLLLKKLGIKCKLEPKWVRVNKDGSISLNWKLSISRKRNLLVFQKLINFSTKEKREKLDEIIKTYSPRTEYGFGYERALAAANALTQKEGFFTSKLLSKELSITSRHTQRYIKKMLEKKDVIKLEGWKYATNPH
jgi:transcriptional regulator with XRE-family HTH domain